MYRRLFVLLAGCQMGAGAPITVVLARLLKVGRYVREREIAGAAEGPPPRPQREAPWHSV